MDKRKIFYPIVIGLAVGIGILIGNVFYQNSQADLSGISLPKKRNIGKLEEALYLLDRNYVDIIDKDALAEEFIPLILKTLDPHSVYLTADEVKESDIELQGSFSGIGVQFNIQNDTVMILSVISGGPSEKLGIMPGDRIIAVDDSTFVGISNSMVLNKLRGKKGSKVKLTIKRRSVATPLEVTITRGDVPINSVDISYKIADNTGYIKISNFGANTYSEFMQAMVSLREQGCSNVIIDLRNNSGGYLYAVIKMTNEFLRRGQLIVYTEGANQKREDVAADGRGNFKKERVCVLINEWSASASEIFAGAIQDHDRGWVIGRRSFGKGLVQQQLPLSDGSQLRLTVARYHTPSGRSIQKPYKKGETEDYDIDIEKRILHGELFHKDSISFPDSLKYYTANGRVVYANGGIMPDVFVPHDTSYQTSYYNTVLNKGIMYEFAFQYVDSQREKFSGMNEWQEVMDYLDKKTKYMKDFIKYAEQKGIAPNQAEIEISKPLINNVLRAYISRNVLGDKGFYPILNTMDVTIEKALEMIYLPLD